MSLRASCCQTALLLWPSKRAAEFAAEDALLAGIDQDVGILVVNELGRALVAAVVDDVESDPLLADSRRFLRDVAERAEDAGTDVGAAFKRLAFVDLLDGELRGVKLLDAVDREIAGFVLDEAHLHRRTALRLNRTRVFESPQIGCAEAGAKRRRRRPLSISAPFVDQWRGAGRFE